MINTTPTTIIPPYRGRLLDLTVPTGAVEELKAYASHLPSIQIAPSALCDIELLACGAYSPLDRFMGREDYLRVLEEMRLTNGDIFPVPVTLSVDPSADLRLDRDIALRSSEYELLGVLTVEEIYGWDRAEFAEKVYGTRDDRHPQVAELRRRGEVNISGRLQVLPLPAHYDFPDLRLTPAQARERLAAAGSSDIIAYQPQDGIPKFDWAELPHNAALLLQLAVGSVKLGDFETYNWVRACTAWALRHDSRALVTVLPRKPLETQQPPIPVDNPSAGERETLLQALIARNYGANQLIAPEGLSVNAVHELGVSVLPEPKQKTELPDETAHLPPSIHTPRHKQGVCIWFTGLSGSGKSTTAEILTWRIMEHGRRVTVLDGDVVRTHLSKGLGFSKEDRDTNVRRIGFVAAELARIGGVVVCSVVSPYRATRDDVRGMLGDHFVEVFVDTPLEVCEARDVKGMYARARSGALKGFTGIDDPYEPPEHPEIILDTVHSTPQENAERVISYLIQQGYLKNENPDHHTHEER